MNRTTTTTTTTRPTLSIVEIARETVADFALGVLPILLPLGGLVVLFVAPLYLLARSVGAL